MYIQLQCLCVSRNYNVDNIYMYTFELIIKIYMKHNTRKQSKYKQILNEMKEEKRFFCRKIEMI